MTMPHLMNCGHWEDGWCLDCVKRLGDSEINLLARVAELEAVVDKLPRTADGVPVVPGDTVFHIDHRGRVESVVANVIDGESIIYGISSFIMLDDCYSTATKALAQAALAPQQRKEGE